ncbi:hypothetical protein QCA50_000695 [Cerrena zonata]|uniref:PI4-kinase N-terminal domain-containing protein n=1 Tax=Cerrena zonata TaxID=2478898 RepID=A0AAW0H0E0_9APHY
MDSKIHMYSQTRVVQDSCSKDISSLWDIQYPQSPVRVVHCPPTNNETILSMRVPSLSYSPFFGVLILASFETYFYVITTSAKCGANSRSHHFIQSHNHQAKFINKRKCNGIQIGGSNWLWDVHHSNYIQHCRSVLSDLGSSIALEFGKGVGPIDRKLSSLSRLLSAKVDRAKQLVGQLATKGYFVGAASGHEIPWTGTKESESSTSSPHEIDLLKTTMSEHIRDIRQKKSTLTIQNLKRPLFRAAAIVIGSQKCDYDLLHYIVVLPFECFTPSTILAGIEVWAWIIGKKVDFEVAIMSEIAFAWISTVKHGWGMFSHTLNQSDPFTHPVEYSPSDKKTVNRTSTKFPDAEVDTDVH